MIYLPDDDDDDGAGSPPSYGIADSNEDALFCRGLGSSCPITRLILDPSCHSDLTLLDLVQLLGVDVGRTTTHQVFEAQTGL